MDIIYTAAFMPYRRCFPWANIESFIQSWVLSVLMAQHEFPESPITIQCYDDLAIGFFERLQLPKIQLVRQQIDWNYAGMWVLPKLYSYARAEGEFLHLDHDVFLHTGFRAVFDAHLGRLSDFIFQQPEGMSLYQHGRIGAETHDGLSYWQQHQPRYPNVGVLYARQNTWAKRLLQEAEGFIQRNFYYCSEFQGVGLAAALEQQPLGIIAAQAAGATAFILSNPDEYRGITNVQPSVKCITHFMGKTKQRPEVLRWLDLAHRQLNVSAVNLDESYAYLRSMGVGVARPESLHLT